MFQRTFHRTAAAASELARFGFGRVHFLERVHRVANVDVFDFLEVNQRQPVRFLAVLFGQDEAVSLRDSRSVGNFSIGAKFDARRHSDPGQRVRIEVRPRRNVRQVIEDLGLVVALQRVLVLMGFLFDHLQARGAIQAEHQKVVDERLIGIIGHD